MYNFLGTSHDCLLDMWDALIYDRRYICGRFIVSMDSNMIKSHAVHSHVMNKEPKFASMPLTHFEKEIYVSLCIK
jgi:hypothetical protein